MLVDQLSYPRNLLNVVMTGRIDGQGTRTYVDPIIDPADLSDDQLNGFEKALRNLSERERLLIHMRYEVYSSFKGIANYYNVSEKLVRRCLNRAYASLRKGENWKNIVYGANRYHEMLQKQVEEAFPNFYNVDSTCHPKDLQIEELQLSCPIENALKRRGIKTLEDLLWIMKDPDGLMNVRGIGINRVKEVEECIDRLCQQ